MDNLITLTILLTGFVSLLAIGALIDTAIRAYLHQRRATQLRRKYRYF